MSISKIKEIRSKISAELKKTKEKLDEYEKNQKTVNYV